jgi:prolyl-tRNA synthetase
MKNLNIIFFEITDLGLDFGVKTAIIERLFQILFMSTRTYAIQPVREKDYPEWYQQVVKAADLAETSPVRGCMVIKPWGYAIWEHVQKILDQMFKDTGHQNAYFPLFIPKSFLEKEAAHVEGFAKECAVVTHSRLETGPNGELIPASPLEEPLIVRPTSETIIGDAFSRWVESYRDLPLLINQWANVVRWELRTRLFLRTTEFLWQEGHTAHGTSEEAVEETLKMLQVYADFAENYMAMPVILGEKTASERFPGAVNTYCIEAMMQDRKALQAGTSHFLGQNFAKASGIQFLSEKGVKEHAWTTSWGVSTRLIGGLIMTHSDDDGLMVPPKLAPTQVMILPIIHKEETREAVMAVCEALRKDLESQAFADQKIRVAIDKRDLRGGEKMWHWVKKGVPVWVEVGPKDIEQGTVFVGRRDFVEAKGASGARQSIPREAFVTGISEVLQSIQDALYNRALAFRQAHTVEIDSKEDFYAFFTPKDANKPEIHGGFALAHWCGCPEVEAKVKEELKVTIRAIPLQGEKVPGNCIFTGKPSAQRVLFAKSY